MLQVLKKHWLFSIYHEFLVCNPKLKLLFIELKICFVFLVNFVLLRRKERFPVCNYRWWALNVRIVPPFLPTALLIMKNRRWDTRRYVAKLLNQNVISTSNWKSEYRHDALIGSDFLFCVCCHNYYWLVTSPIRAARQMEISLDRLTLLRHSHTRRWFLAWSLMANEVVFGWRTWVWIPAGTTQGTASLRDGYSSISFAQSHPKRSEIGLKQLPVSVPVNEVKLLP